MSETVVGVYSGSRAELAKLHKLPRETFEGYLFKLDASDPDGFVFVGRSETVDLESGDEFVAMDRAELEHLIQRKPAHLLPGIPAIDSVERSAIGETIKIKREARRIAGDNEKVYRREVHRIATKHVKVIEGKIEREADARELRDRHFQIIKEAAEWMAKPFMLQRPEGSVLHKLQEANRDNKLLILLADPKPVHPDFSDSINDMQSFVVEHDWAKVINGAEITGQGSGEIRVGFKASAFEFVVSGVRTVAVIVEDQYGIHQTRMMIIARMDHGWAVLMTYILSSDWKPTHLIIEEEKKRQVAQTMQPLAELLASNIKAICIMLEAEVAQTEVIRVDAKLNRAREKRGKLPLSDYHVVSLTRRERALPRERGLLDPDREIIHKRLHFRRGHWRHYADHRTWIKWCLVGDPDLGFVDKHYKL